MQKTDQRYAHLSRWEDQHTHTNKHIRRRARYSNIVEICINNIRTRRRRKSTRMACEWRPCRKHASNYLNMCMPFIRWWIGRLFLSHAKKGPTTHSIMLMQLHQVSFSCASFNSVLIIHLNTLCRPIHSMQTSTNASAPTCIAALPAPNASTHAAVSTVCSRRSRAAHRPRWPIRCWRNVSASIALRVSRFWWTNAWTSMSASAIGRCATRIRTVSICQAVSGANARWGSSWTLLRTLVWVSVPDKSFEFHIEGFKSQAFGRHC